MAAIKEYRILLEVDAKRAFGFLDAFKKAFKEAMDLHVEASAKAGDEQAAAAEAAAVRSVQATQRAASEIIQTETKVTNNKKKLTAEQAAEFEQAQRDQIKAIKKAVELMEKEDIAKGLKRRKIVIESLKNEIEIEESKYKQSKIILEAKLKDVEKGSIAEARLLKQKEQMTLAHLKRIDAIEDKIRMKSLRKFSEIVPHHVTEIAENMTTSVQGLLAGNLAPLGAFLGGQLGGIVGGALTLALPVISEILGDLFKTAAEKAREMRERIAELSTMQLGMEEAETKISLAIDTGDTEPAIEAVRGQLENIERIAPGASEHIKQLLDSPEGKTKEGLEFIQGQLKLIAENAKVAREALVFKEAQKSLDGLSGELDDMFKSITENDIATMFALIKVDPSAMQAQLQAQREQLQASLAMEQSEEERVEIGEKISDITDKIHRVKQLELGVSDAVGHTLQSQIQAEEILLGRALERSEAERLAARVREEALDAGFISEEAIDAALASITNKYYEINAAAERLPALSQDQLDAMIEQEATANELLQTLIEEGMTQEEKAAAEREALELKRAELEQVLALLDAQIAEIEGAIHAQEASTMAEAERAKMAQKHAQIQQQIQEIIRGERKELLAVQLVAEGKFTQALDKVKAQRDRVAKSIEAIDKRIAGIGRSAPRGGGGGGRARDTGDAERERRERERAEEEARREREKRLMDEMKKRQELIIKEIKERHEQFQSMMKEREERHKAAEELKQFSKQLDDSAKQMRSTFITNIGSITLQYINQFERAVIDASKSLETLSERNAGLENQLRDNSAEMTRLHGIISASRGELRRLEANLGNVNDRLNTIQIVRGAAAGAAAGLPELENKLIEVKELIKQIPDVGSISQKVIDRLRELAPGEAAIQAGIRTLQDRQIWVNAVNEFSDALGRQINEIKSQSQGGGQLTEAQESGLMQQREQLHGQIESIRKDIRDAENRITALNNQRALLQRDLGRTDLQALANLTNQVTVLGHILQRRKEIAAIQQQIEAAGTVEEANRLRERAIALESQLLVQMEKMIIERKNEAGQIEYVQFSQERIIKEAEDLFSILRGNNEIRSQATEEEKAALDHVQTLIELLDQVTAQNEYIKFQQSNISHLTLAAMLARTKEQAIIDDALKLGLTELEIEKRRVALAKQAIYQAQALIERRADEAAAAKDALSAGIGTVEQYDHALALLDQALAAQKEIIATQEEGEKRINELRRQNFEKVLSLSKTLMDEGGDIYAQTLSKQADLYKELEERQAEIAQLSQDGAISEEKRVELVSQAKRAYQKNIDALHNINDAFAEIETRSGKIAKGAGAWGKAMTTAAKAAAGQEQSIAAVGEALGAVTTAVQGASEAIMGTVESAGRIGALFGAGKARAGVQEITDLTGEIGAALLNAPDPGLKTVGAILLLGAGIVNIVTDIIETIVGKELTATQQAEMRSAQEAAISAEYQAQIVALDTLAELEGRSVDQARERLGFIERAHKEALAESSVRRQLAALGDEELARMQQRGEAWRAEQERRKKAAEILKDAGRAEQEAFLRSVGWQVEWWMNTATLMEEFIEATEADLINQETRLDLIKDEVEYRKELLRLRKEELKEEMELLSLRGRLRFGETGREELEAQLALQRKELQMQLAGIGINITGMTNAAVKSLLSEMLKNVDQSQIGPEIQEIIESWLDADAALREFIETGSRIDDMRREIRSLRRELGEITQEEYIAEERAYMEERIRELRAHEESLIQQGAAEHEILQATLARLQAEKELKDILSEQNNELNKMPKIITELLRARQKEIEHMRLLQRLGVDVSAKRRELMARDENIRTRAREAGLSEEQIEALMAGLPAFQKGGYVPFTGPALLHAGEIVIPAEIVRQLNMANFQPAQIMAQRQMQRDSIYHNISVAMGGVNVTNNNIFQNGDRSAAAALGLQLAPVIWEQVNRGIIGGRIKLERGTG